MRGDFTTIRTVGSTLPPDLLERLITGDSALGSLEGSSYHLLPGETPRAAAQRSWTYLKQAWSALRAQLERLPEGDPAIGATREAWIYPLLRELGFGRPEQTPAGGLQVEGHGYPVSHLHQRVPLHLLGWGVTLDRRSKGVRGAADRAPHAMVQEAINRADDVLWAIVTNGRSLRLLRDSTSLTGQSFVEFDLETMFDGDVFSDFVVLYLLAHASRFETAPGEPPASCIIEAWRSTTRDTGVRALGLLRDGVTTAIGELGAGLLEHPANGDLRDMLECGEMSVEELHRELIRLVYRMLFLFVAEDRPEPDLVLREDVTDVQRERWTEYYSGRALRVRARTLARTSHGDEWHRLWVVLDGLGRDGIAELGLAGLGGLFAPSPGEQLSRAADGSSSSGPRWQLSNSHLLAAVRALSVIRPKGQREQLVDFGRLGAEELGGIYESLLELVPRLDREAWDFRLEELAGNDRKTTGSYYTPTELVDLVLDESLEPVLDAAQRSDDPEQALLGVTVCDPACGSGHMIVAAARRIARRLAEVRAEHADLTADDLDAAMREVVVRCIYGVDVQPMAAELAKVSLWLESMERGKPLAFLDHHIKVGNSLLGATPALLARGIPDDAFKPIAGDDKKVLSELKKRNKAERGGEGALFDLAGGDGVAHLAASAVDALRRVSVQRTAAEVEQTRARFESLEHDPEMERARREADTWCAAFTAPRVDRTLGLTTDSVAAAREGRLGEHLTAVVAEQARDFGYFHWHLEFPEVFTPKHEADIAEDDPTGWEGGFSAMVGNPPWERIKLQEKEFFAQRDAEVAGAKNAAARKKLIAGLKDANPSLAAEWERASRQAEATSAWLRLSGRYPLCGVGDVNTYAVFAELFRSSIGRSGRMGIITPTGLATDATTSAFFADTLRARRLATFYDFENEAKIFAGVDHRVRFAVTSMTGGERVKSARLAFLIRHLVDVAEKRFALTSDEILALNPNTGTLPLFRTRRDAEITLGIYRRFPVLVNDATGENPWGLSFMRMFDMANDSGLFEDEGSLTSKGATFDGWAWTQGDRRWLPLYEAKMLSHYDSRFSTYEGATQAQLNVGSLPRLTDAQHDDPDHEVLARYWVEESEVDAQLRDRWKHGWLLGWRSTGRASDARTFISTAIPTTAVSGKFPLAFGGASWLLSAILSSLPHDYVTRQKSSGADLSMFMVQQLAVPKPECEWTSLAGVNEELGNWLRPRVLELQYTADRLAPFAADLIGLPDGQVPSPPFRWRAERREQLRAEIDAAMFHLYGLPREDVEHVLDSFTVVRKYDERDHGEYRTKRLILEIYDAMADAAVRGEYYVSPLDPPPGHGPRHPER